MASRMFSGVVPATCCRRSLRRTITLTASIAASGTDAIRPRRCASRGDRAVNPGTSSFRARIFSRSNCAASTYGTDTSTISSFFKVIFFSFFKSGSGCVCAGGGSGRSPVARFDGGHRDVEKRSGFVVGRLCFVVGRLCFVVGRLCFVVGRLCFVVGRLRFALRRLFFVLRRLGFVVGRLFFIVRRLRFVFRRLGLVLRR